MFGGVRRPEATLAVVPAERIAESLAFINWTVLTTLGSGAFAAVVAGRFRTDATRGYLAFTAFSAAGFALLAGLADSGLPVLSPALAVRADPAWEGPRRVALLALPVIAAVYGVALLRGARAAPIALAGLAAAALALVAGALSWGGGGLASLLLLVELAGLAAVLGVVWAAMILGHWYLVTPRLPEAPLVRFARWLGLGLALQLALFVAWLGFGAGPAGVPAFAALVGPWALFIWLRLLVGLVFPLVVSWAAIQTARSRSMESATGLLYINVGTIAAGTILAAGLYFGAGLLA
jgi:hypothetical protein